MRGKHIWKPLPKLRVLERILWPSPSLSTYHAPGKKEKHNTVQGLAIIQLIHIACTAKVWIAVVPYAKLAEASNASKP